MSPQSTTATTARNGSREELDPDLFVLRDYSREQSEG